MINELLFIAKYVSHCSGSRDPELTRKELLRIHELGRNANLATLDTLGMLVIHCRLPFTSLLQPLKKKKYHYTYVLSSY
jgi:hypothetical protein